MKTAKMLLAFALLPQLAVADDPEKPQPPVTGSWVLRTVTINGKPAADLSGILKDFGGCELGMVYKFRRDSFGSVNDFPVYFEYAAETKEQLIMPKEGDKDATAIFDTRMAGKNLQLRFKQGNKTVVMAFAPDL